MSQSIAGIGELRLARMSDVPAIELLIPASVHQLQAPHYTPAQMNAALGTVFGVDRQLIRDGTYFVIEQSKVTDIIACGGWSRRRTLFGADAARTGEDPLLDPAHDAARIRAFFVHPDFARRGLGRALLEASERAMQAAGFRRVEIVATLTGELLYAAFGYTVVERFPIPMTGGLELPAVRMTKSWIN